MNKVVTSREAILEVCKTLASNEGLEAINMRAVAKACNVAVGSLYNYYPTKGELLTATVQAVWEEIVAPLYTLNESLTFLDLIQKFYEIIKQGSDQYPSFFTLHALSFSNEEKEHGKSKMTQFFSHLSKRFLKALKTDPLYNAINFNETFTEEHLMAFIFRNIMAMLILKNDDCDYLIEVTRRLISSMSV